MIKLHFCEDYSTFWYTKNQKSAECFFPSLLPDKKNCVDFVLFYLVGIKKSSTFA